MKLLQLRRYFNDTTTISEVYLESFKPENFLIYHLEDVDRGLNSMMTEQAILAKKVQGKTAIPYGEYEVIIDRSNRFSKKASEKAGHPVDVYMPLLKDVKGYAGIRIHPGIKAEHTDGCQCTGSKFVDKDPTHPGFEEVANSQAAYDKIFGTIQEGLKNGKVFIKIDKHPSPESFLTV